MVGTMRLISVTLAAHSDCSVSAVSPYYGLLLIRNSKLRCWPISCACSRIPCVFALGFSVGVPAFNQMLKAAVRGRFRVLMVWSIDRLGRSVLHVASAMAEMAAAGVAEHTRGELKAMNLPQSPP
jgi:hypothetical protein